MPTAFTGSLGWTGAHPIQLGGPPLISTWGRPLASSALPLLAHAYQNDGVTPITVSLPGQQAGATFGILNRPSIRATFANGGYDQVTLEVAGPVSGLAQGNVVRLTEVGGPWAGFVYSGIAESFPDTRSSTGPKHEIVLTPFGAELTRVATQLVYTAGVDIAQAVRDAVALTQHCSCDHASVPPATGIPLVSTSGAQVDFRGQKVNQVLDTCRSIAGPTWFWYCDELGRVWFQAQGSGPGPLTTSLTQGYTLQEGVHYEERVTNGGDIQARINQVPAVGGLDPTNPSQNVKVTVNGASQSSIGIRTLDPPLSVPGVNDSVTLALIANGILGTLDQTWTRVRLKALPTFAQRVHGSQPGGAMFRYREGAVNPLPESEVGAGYVGPFIVQSVDYDGLYQQIEAGNIPVTNQTDIDNMVRTLINRSAAFQLINTAAALNLNQTLTGSFQSGTATVGPNGQRATLWSLGQQEFQAIDPNAITRAEMGNLPARGISPAQWGFRASDANGNPIFDSLGLIEVADLLATDAPGAQTAAGSGAGFGTVQTVPGSGSNFTCPRSGRILCTSTLSWVNTAGAVNYVAIYFGIWTQAGSLVTRARVSGAGTLQNNNYFMNPTNVFVGLLANAALQFRLEFALDATTTACGFGTGATGIPPVSQVIALGS